jgi:serine/threonine-protein kinase
VLEGTIRWDRGGEGHGRVRITPQLIRVKDDLHLWGDRFDHVLDDIFGVQSDIATRVIEGLSVSLLNPERRSIENRPTDDMNAYQAYLLGTHYLHGDTEESSQRLTIEMLERAVEFDPAFALAHAMLSRAHSRLYHYRFDFSEERLEKARLSAERAFELLPAAPEVHLALGYYYYWGQREYDLALDEFSSVLGSQPNNPEGLEALFYLYRRTGRWQDALQSIERIRRFDPQSYSAAWHAHDTYQFVRDYESAEMAFRRAMELAPDRHEAYSDGAWTFALWDGSTRRARLLLESAPIQNSRRMEYTAILLDLFDRDYQAALSRAESVSDEGISLQLWFVPKDLIRCLCLPEIGRIDEGIQACEKAVDSLREKITEAPHDHRLHIALGHALVLLGRDEEAIRAGELGASLMPISKDAMDGTFQSIELAKIYAQAGRLGQALDLIDELLSIPCGLSTGLLRLDPVWDPIRDHPRFQEILEKYDVAAN